MVLLRFILAVAALMLAGYSSALWLVGHLGWSRAARWALAYVIGLGVVSTTLLLLEMAGLPLAAATILVPALGLAALLQAAYGQCTSRKKAASPASATPWTRLDKGLAAGLAFQALFSFTLALSTPMNQRDALINWALRGKAFFLEGHITSAHILDRHVYYPQLVPLNLTWVYLVTGAVTDTLSKALFPLCLLALIVLFYQFLRSAGWARTEALLATLYLSMGGGMLMRHSGLAVADLPLSLFYTVAGLALFAWTRRPSEIRYLVLAGLAAGLAAWTKHEGLVHAAILAGVGSLFLLAQGRPGLIPALPRLLMAFGLPLALGILPWLVFRQLNGLAVDGEHRSAFQLSRLPTILVTMARAMLDVQRWGVLWPLLALALILDIRLFRQPTLLYPALMVGLNLAFYVVAYLATEHSNLVGQINDTIHRLLLHILPLAVFLLAGWVRAWTRAIFSSDVPPTAATSW